MMESSKKILVFNNFIFQFLNDLPSKLRNILKPNNENANKNERISVEQLGQNFEDELGTDKELEVKKSFSGF